MICDVWFQKLAGRLVVFAFGRFQRVQTTIGQARKLGAQTHTDMQQCPATPFRWFPVYSSQGSFPNKLSDMRIVGSWQVGSTKQRVMDQWRIEVAIISWLRGSGIISRASWLRLPWLPSKQKQSQPIQREVARGWKGKGLSASWPRP